MSPPPPSQQPAPEQKALRNDANRRISQISPPTQHPKGGGRRIQPHPLHPSPPRCCKKTKLGGKGGKTMQTAGKHSSHLWCVSPPQGLLLLTAWLEVKHPSRCHGRPGFSSHPVFISTLLAGFVVVSGGYCLFIRPAEIRRKKAGSA